MVWGILSILVAAVTALPTFAQTAPTDLKRYIDFAVEWTPYAYTGQPYPKIKLERHDIVQVYGYGELETAQAEEQGIELPVVNAVYVPEDKTIYVSDRISLNDPKIESTMVHEIVHYLQDITGYTRSLEGHIACTEADAYDVQMLWQKINNVDIDDIPFVYQQALLSATRCMGNKTSAISKAFAAQTNDAKVLTRR